MKKNKIKNTILILSICCIQFNVFSQSNFSPQNITGLKLWVTADSSKSTTNPIIDTLYDLTGNTNHLYQANLINKPVSSGTLLNGHKTALFDGVDDYFLFNGLNDIRTIFWVIKDNNDIVNSFRPLLGDDINYPFYRSSSKIWDLTYADSKVLNGVTRLNSNVIDGATTDMPTNFTLINVVTTGNIIAKSFSIDRNITNRVWNGELAELIIYNQALTPAQVLQVEDYLNNKYAPPIVLPNDITISNSYCDTVITSINPNNNKYSYQWSNGATTATISVNNSGKYWVKATNIFGNTSADTIQVNFPNYNPPAVTAICQGDTLKWNTGLPKNQYSFQWQDNSADSVFTINQTGNYFVKITDGFGCSITTNTITISQDNFASQVSLGPDVSLCAGNFIALTTGSLSGSSYTWSDGSHANSLAINNTGAYSVVVTNTNNCIARDTINVTVLGQAPVANFTTGVGCQNNQVTFTNLSTPPTGNTIVSNNWDFGDLLSSSNTSTLTNPSHTYTNTGTYTINLNVTTNTGCSQTISKTLTVYPKPSVNFSNGISCQNDSTTFSNLSTSALGYSITSLAWDFGDAASGIANTSTLQSPKHVFSAQFVYTVSLTATNNVNCSETLSKIVVSKAEVTASFTNSPPCQGIPTLFQDNSIAPVSSARLWDFGTSTFVGLTCTKTYTSSGIYNVKLTVTGTNGCISTTQKQIIVYLPPKSNFSVPVFCETDTINIKDLSLPQSGIIFSYKWSLNTSPLSTVANPTLTLKNAGTHTISLIVSNSFGCKDSVTKFINVLASPKVDFVTTPESFLYINSTITFSPNISNATSYLWSIPNYTNSSVKSPTVIFNTEGTYPVSLTIKDHFGCKNTISKSILVSKPYLEVAVLNSKSMKDVDNFFTVESDIVNYGTLPVTSLKLHYIINDGINAKTVWNGNLLPNSILTYTFNSSSAVKQNIENNIICLTIDKVNGVNDEDLSNNHLCNVLNADENSVQNPIPNPTEGDIKLPVVLKSDGIIIVSIYNSLGQVYHEPTIYNGLSGLNYINLSTASYARGNYMIKISIDEKLFTKKFIKTSTR